MLLESGFRHWRPSAVRPGQDGINRFSPCKSTGKLLFFPKMVKKKCKVLIRINSFLHRNITVSQTAIGSLQLGSQATSSRSNFLPPHNACTYVSMIGTIHWLLANQCRATNKPQCTITEYKATAI